MDIIVHYFDIDNISSWKTKATILNFWHTDLSRFKIREDKYLSFNRNNNFGIVKSDTYINDNGDSIVDFLYIEAAFNYISPVGILNIKL